jgi:hypothetical protein
MTFHVVCISEGTGGCISRDLDSSIALTALARLVWVERKTRLAPVRLETSVMMRVWVLISISVCLSFHEDTTTFRINNDRGNISFALRYRQGPQKGRPTLSPLVQRAAQAEGPRIRRAGRYTTRQGSGGLGRGRASLPPGAGQGDSLPGGAPARRTSRGRGPGRGWVGGRAGAGAGVRGNRQKIRARGRDGDPPLSQNVGFKIGGRRVKRYRTQNPYTPVPKMLPSLSEQASAHRIWLSGTPRKRPGCVRLCRKSTHRVSDIGQMCRLNLLVFSNSVDNVIYFPYARETTLSLSLSLSLSIGRLEIDIPT